MAGNASGAVVVTGASTGIGRATALLLDKKGYTVFAGVRKEEDAKSLAAEGSDRLTPITIDVTEERSIADAKRNGASRPSARKASSAWSTTPGSAAAVRSSSCRSTASARRSR